MIFVRIKDIVPLGLTFDAETQIYEESKKRFDKVVILSSESTNLCLGLNCCQKTL
jgi:hypothetical protein